MTVFFVTVASIAAAGLTVVLKEEARSTLSVDLVAALFFLVAALGLVAVLILAKLRAVQLEHFRIISKIRQHFLKDDDALWDVVELSGSTLPKPSRRSGTYMWLSAILLVSGYAFGTAGYLLLRTANNWVDNWLAWLIAVTTALAWVALLDALYFRLAQPPPEPTYATDPREVLGITQRKA